MCMTPWCMLHSVVPVALFIHTASAPSHCFKNLSIRLALELSIESWIYLNNGLALVAICHVPFQHGLAIPWSLYAVVMVNTCGHRRTACAEAPVRCFVALVWLCSSTLDTKNRCLHVFKRAIKHRYILYIQPASTCNCYIPSCYFIIKPHNLNESR